MPTRTRARTYIHIHAVSALIYNTLRRKSRCITGRADDIIIIMIN